ncbi:unnamed protein product, partial [Rotaria sp. Silwood1]
MDHDLTGHLHQVDKNKIWRHIVGILIITTMNEHELKSYVSEFVQNMATIIIQSIEDLQEQKEDLLKLKEMLVNSHYPPDDIEKLIKQACENINSNSNANNTTNQNNNNQKLHYSLCLPHVPGSE